jgi:hypothetical protein
MAFTSAVTERTIMGNKRVHFGTWTTDTTGGDIDTGLKTCEFITLQTSGAAVSADQSSVNETLPVAGSAVTIVCTSGADGYWMAMGY